MNNHTMSDEYQDEDIHLRAILDKYLVHWHWFILGASLCFAMAYVYLRYTVPQYQASTTILVKDDKKGGMLSELSAFSDLGLSGGMKSNVDNEIEILKSRTLVESTVKKLNLNIKFLVEGNVVTRELYQHTPVAVYFADQSKQLYENSANFKLVELTPTSFELENESESDTTKFILSSKKQFRYGELINTKLGHLIVSRAKLSSDCFKGENKSVQIQITPLDNVVASFSGRLKVDPISKTSSVVALSITDPVVKKAEDFLNNLVQIYNADAAADKNFISENTSKFIANRLVLITQELDGVEQDVQRFKTANNLTDIQSEAQLYIEGSSDYNKKSAENEIQLNVVSSLLDFMKKSTNSDLLPGNIIAGESDASGLISSYNTLVLDRNRILKSATVSNPTVVKLDQQLGSLKANVTASLLRMQSSLQIQKRNLTSNESRLNTKIEKIPVQERQFRAVARQQKVKEELYLYLLQKREETAISLSATEPNARVVDVAMAGKAPIAPKKNIIYLAALLLGLLIPFAILYVKDLLDTKVKVRADLTDKFNIPFLGDVPKSFSPNEIISTTSRTSAAEALRIVRSNLDFMLNQVPDGKAKNIFVTSTIPGEGKTFISVNLASIFALSGNKVLLIGMDIRSPKLNEYVGLAAGAKGLTDYLSVKDGAIGDYINKLDHFESLDVLLAGSVPPNPTEMLMGKRLESLMTQLKTQYDFIIVDTAPVSLVSDTLIVAKHADTFVYVVRANHLDKRMLNVPNTMHKENKLPNMAFLLNDTEVIKGYGYGYGAYSYHNTEKKKPWYKQIFKK